MRYLPASEEDIRHMLAAAGLERVEDLFSSIPPDLRAKDLDSPDGLSELELARRFLSRSRRNVSSTCRPCFLGAGAYAHHIPSPVDHVLLRTEFYTAYTPYQPETSQGTLQSIYEFQTMMADLTGMDYANASLYDGASATAEAALMAWRARKGGRILVARSLHPAYREVLATYVRHLGIDIVEIPFGTDGRLDLDALGEDTCDGASALLVGQPNFFGIVEDPAAIAERLPGKKPPLLTAVVSEALSLAALRAPGSAGADIVAGDARSFGLPLGYGGPYLGFIASKKPFLRQLPGRICGETTDTEGRRGYVLTLSTREQHIRREKATSNICTNQGLCMLAATVYLSLTGRRGLAELARQNLSKAEYLKERLVEKGCEPVFTGPTFNEFAVRPRNRDGVSQALRDANILGGYDLANAYPELEGAILLAATELVSRSDCDRLADILGGAS